MPIKHVHKLLASINEKTLFDINFSSIVIETKKQKRKYLFKLLF